MTAAVGVLKGQTAMSYKSELQTLTKQSMRHQVCTGETRHISESTITMLMSRGRSNCGVTYYMSMRIRDLISLTIYFITKHVHDYNLCFNILLGTLLVIIILHDLTVIHSQ